jgi:hypothetical protein
MQQYNQPELKTSPTNSSRPPIIHKLSLDQLSLSSDFNGSNSLRNRKSKGASQPLTKGSRADYRRFERTLPRYSHQRNSRVNR